MNPINSVFEAIDFIPNERARKIIARRFGLADGQRHTLEAIGKDYGITRERVRQIEENGLEALRRPAALKKIQPFFDLAHNHLEEHGNLRREKKLRRFVLYLFSC